MTKSNKLPAEKIRALLPRDGRLVFDRVPLLMGEQQSDYDHFFAGFVDAIRPRDFVEQMKVEDCAMMTVELNRYNHARAGIVENAKKDALRRILESILPADRRHELDNLASGYFLDPDVHAEIDKMALKFGMWDDFIGVEALASRLNEVRLLEKLSDKKRNGIMRALEQIEHRRMVLGRSLVPVDQLAVDHANTPAD